MPPCLGSMVHILHQDCNCPQCPIVKSVLILGSADIQGCGHRILPGGVEVPGSCSEGFVQGRDAGELQEPGLPG